MYTHKGQAPEALRTHFEALASDPSFKLRRSRRGNYVNPAVARDWKWFQLGASQAQQPAPAAGAVAGPMDDLAELLLLNRLIELGNKAAGAHATSNSDDGHKGTAAYVEWQELRAEMGELIRTAYAAAPTPAAQADSAPAQCSYSIDADPQGIRAMVADAITGALAFGAQGANPPPAGHWLAPFWNAARADHTRSGSALEDASRWNEVLMHVGAANHLGGQHFTLNTLRIRDQMFLLRGSVAQHFTACIDDSRAARKQGGA